MFFLIPVGVDFRTDRWPVVTFSIIGLCVAIYVVGVSLFLSHVGESEIFSDPIIDRFALVPNQTTFVTWFSHIFLHAGLFHLLGNMVYLFLFGSVVEDIVGRGKFILFFLLGGLAAAAIHILFSTQESGHIPMVGASGAISACLGAFVIFQTHTHVQFRYFFWIIVPVFNGEFTLPSWLVISFWFLKDVIGLVVDTLAPSAGGGIAFGAHVGGMITGLIIAVGYRMIEKLRDERTEKPSFPSGKPNTGRIFYIHHQDQQLGPYTQDQVDVLVSEEYFGPEALFWTEGMSDWKPLRQFPTLGGHP